MQSEENAVMCFLLSAVQQGPQELALHPASPLPCYKWGDTAFGWCADFACPPQKEN